MEYEDDSSNESGADDGDQLEVAHLLGEDIEIPQGLAESAEIFQEFFNFSTWQSLNPSDQAHLMKFLPTFPENNTYEKSITLRRLFNRENFKFGSPLQDFHDKLQRGHFRPDIAHLRRLMKKGERRQYNEQRKRYAFALLKEVIVGRREVLETACNSSPGPLKIQRQYLSNNPAVDPLLQLVKKRYFQELAAVRSEVGEYSQSSEDENYTERAPRSLSKKQRQKLATLETSLAESDMTAVTPTLATKPTGFDLETHVTNSSNPYEITDELFKKMVIAHRKRRFMQEKHPNLNTSGITLRDVAVRSQIGQRRPSGKSSRGASASPYEKLKRKASTSGSTPASRGNESEESLVKRLKKELESEISKKSEDSTDEEVQRAMERNEGERNIDVESASPTNIPQNQKLIEKQGQHHNAEVPLPTVSKPLAVPGSSADTPIKEIKEEDDPKYRFRQAELMQDTHVCFFSLLRDIICSSPQHRMRADKIEMKLRAWETNPISPLNEWFSLVDDSWSNLLDSALSFLSGDYPAEFQPDDFVPYIEYKPTIKSYQWIGAGRDSDVHLLMLCSHWLDHREVLGTAIPPADLELDDADLDDIEEEVETVDVDALPPPRYPTTWTVRPSTDEEKAIFQEQERERFANPTKAFTYRMHGYESVVGPVKGIYNSQTSTSVLKPRGHNLLSHNRPNYVTVLALVRDAAARLPNGEGTRADMCTLIRDSQYLDLSTAGDTTLQGVVSGALDRLHYEVDACVRFDTKRKLWVYLHRRRSEAEMEKMHQQYQGISKTIKKAPRKRTTKKADGSGAGKDKDPSEKPQRKPKAAGARARGKEIDQEESAAEVETESLVKASSTPEPPDPTPKLEPRQQAQEIITSSGKKILIQTTFAGVRTPVKFVPTAAKLLTGGTTKVVGTVQGTLLKQQAGAAETTQTLLKPATTATSPFIVKNLAPGAQFLTTSGQKVQIIASAQQNLGQIQSIQLSNGQNIVTQSLPSASATAGTSGSVAGSNLLQNIQQVQILTSSGQIITRAIPTNATSTVAGLSARPVAHTTVDDLKTQAGTAQVRNTLAGLQMTLSKAGKNLKNVRMVSCHSPTAVDAKPTMSLLASSQGIRVDKEKDAKPVTMQMIQKQPGKVATQVINVSGVQLLNKPLIAKNNTSVLTGVKLVSTQQGVKMVATSATTVVQTSIPSSKPTSTVTKTLQVSNQLSAVPGVSKVTRGSPQIISMEALVQGARNNTSNKGPTSLIQLPSSSGGLTQFAVVSQGNLLSVSGQPRIVQAQQLSGVTSVTQAQRTLISSSTSSQAKPTLSTVRMGSNVTLAGVKPVILAKTQPQSQNVILSADGSAGGQTLVLSSQGTVRASAPGTVTVVQPTGAQQILLPTTFPAGTINLKSLQGLQGLKVIPISGSSQKVYARFLKNPQPHQVDVPKTEEQ